MVTTIPVFIMNKLLRTTSNRDKLMIYMKYIDNYPNWLGTSEKDIKVATKHGFELYCDRTDYIGRTIIEVGEWEPLISRTILKCLRPGDTAIDIGANIGYDSLLMATAVGEKGQVISFEPNPANSYRLLSNVFLNRLNNVCIQTLALSNSLGWGNITIEGEYGHANLRNESTSKKTHRVMTAELDRVLSLDSDNRVRLVKMDIEGFEYNVLQGMKSVLNNVDYLICEVDDEFLKQCGGSSKMLMDFMRDNGFTAYCADPESNEKWVKCDHTYKQKKQYSSGHIAFDALFCKVVDETLDQLVS